MENNSNLESMAKLDLGRKERLEYVVKNLSEAAYELKVAETEETINKALEKLATEVNYFSNQPGFCEIGFADLSGMIRSTMLHNVTRSELCEFIENFLEYVRGLIAEEEKKEQAQKQAKALKELLLQMAEHSSELVELLDITNILG